MYSSFDDSIESEAVDQFLQKPFWFFIRIFQTSRYDSYLYSYSSKSYDSVVLSDFEVTFLGEGEDVAFWPFLYCFVDELCYLIEEVCCQISLSSKF